MINSRRMLLTAVITCVGALSCSPALAASQPTSPASTKTTSIKAHALLTSRELWATIDVCSPTDQPNTVGVRGSMPEDGHAGDKLFMAFRLQYLNSAGVWVDLVPGVKPSYVSVAGKPAAVREGGSSFQLVPVAGKPASTLRGIVDFQWRRGKKILLSASRPTGAGHRSASGADPAGYSAASCLIG